MADWLAHPKRTTPISIPNSLEDAVKDDDGSLEDIDLDSILYFIEAHPNHLLSIMYVALRSASALRAQWKQRLTSVGGAV